MQVVWGFFREEEDGGKGRKGGRGVIGPVSAWNAPVKRVEPAVAAIIAQLSRTTPSMTKIGRSLISSVELTGQGFGVLSGRLYPCKSAAGNASSFKGKDWTGEVSD
jgi:hypothetical protein